jgi:N-acetylneuraminate synthase
LGARFVEKHFTLDNNLEGPDHFFAMNPKSWREMVDVSNQVFRALGDGHKRVEENEIDSAIVQRRAIRATRDLKMGHRLTNEDIEVLRPCPNGAFAPYEKEVVLGKSLKSDIKQGDYLKRSQI